MDATTLILVVAVAAAFLFIFLTAGRSRNLLEGHTSRLPMSTKTRRHCKIGKADKCIQYCLAENPGNTEDCTADCCPLAYSHDCGCCTACCGLDQACLSQCDCH